ncbi:hypothetical protein FNF27_00023 [Cafeteria roenbergensis]|uniref:Uncharacterized protein n=1 Tax=Cafeteria roenbergensis TaxID=33653 RepID=A0A5A8EJT4_CAFRO|nr:hypothetical protein FNF27_00023 [Cafeteria roenbergensis]
MFEPMATGLDTAGIRFDFARQVAAHSGCVNATAFSRDGRLLASSGDDGRVLVHHVADLLSGTGEPSVAMRGSLSHCANVFHAEFDPAGERILTGALDGSVAVHEVSGGLGADRVMPGHGDRVHTNAVHAVCWVDVISSGASWAKAPGRLFASGSADGTIGLFDTREGWDCRPAERIATGSPVHGMAAHPSMPWYLAAATKDAGLMVFDLRMTLGPGRLLPSGGWDAMRPSLFDAARPCRSCGLGRAAVSQERVPRRARSR